MIDELIDGLLPPELLAPEDEDFVDNSPTRAWGKPAKARMYTLPAHGLRAVEGRGPFIHVVNAGGGDDLELTENLGEKETVRVDGANFNPDYFVNHLNILSRGGKIPVRVVLHNLGMIKQNHVSELEKIMNRENNYPIKTIFFVDSGDEVNPAFRHKILMSCGAMVDSATLLDAIAYGWGTKNLYDGMGPAKEEIAPFPAEFIPSSEPLSDTSPDTAEIPGAGPPDFIPSHVPLSVDSEDQTFGGV